MSYTSQLNKMMGWTLLVVLAGAHSNLVHAAPPQRTNNRSPAYVVQEEDVGLFMDYTGYKYSDKERTKGERFFVSGIDAKAVEMINGAQDLVIMSLFLFDSFYAGETKGRNPVDALTRLLVEKKKKNPDMTIVVILDQSHKGYGNRESPSVRAFREAGIDIFYSDLVSGLRRAAFVGFREGSSHVNRVMDRLTKNVWGNTFSAIFSRMRFRKVKFDHEQVSLEMVYNAFLLKANHRKILLTDRADGDLEVFVSSGNPHNASAYHVNHALSARGSVAEYMYEVLRKDVSHSIGLGKRYAHWHDGADRAYRKKYLVDQLPSRPGLYNPQGSGRVAVQAVTEFEIPTALIQALENVESTDEIRIQMFYLAYQPIVKAIIQAAEVTDQPIRLLMDAAKDSFNKEKDGTPNRQVAQYLKEKLGDKIEIRWYSTHGEQNHAKSMSITNPGNGKRFFTTGSCNWTGRNMAGVNMEANLIIEGADSINQKFNETFDLLWSNGDGNEYTLDYGAFEEAAGDWKWHFGEHPFYWSSF